MHNPDMAQDMKTDPFYLKPWLLTLLSSPDRYKILGNNFLPLTLGGTLKGIEEYHDNNHDKQHLPVRLLMDVHFLTDYQTKTVFTGGWSEQQSSLMEGFPTLAQLHEKVYDPWELCLPRCRQNPHKILLSLTVQAHGEQQRVH